MAKTRIQKPALGAERLEIQPGKFITGTTREIAATRGRTLIEVTEAGGRKHRLLPAQILSRETVKGAKPEAPTAEFPPAAEPVPAPPAETTADAGPAAETPPES